MGGYVKTLTCLPRTIFDLKNIPLFPKLNIESFMSIHDRNTKNASRLYGQLAFMICMKTTIDFQILDGLSWAGPFSVIILIRKLMILIPGWPEGA